MAIIIDVPDNCIGCMFKLPATEICVGNGLYKRISHCRFAPESIKDPWRDLQWMVDNKEPYCPLKSYTEQTATDIEDGIHIPQDTFEVEGFNCKVDSYNEKEFTLQVQDISIPYSLAPKVCSIFTKRYGYGVRVGFRGYSTTVGNCIVSIPAENIIERGGLL